ncbi:hypothetical protein [Gloeobacter morelensis]|uniref:CRISPR-associated protein n=1 Tax=Gloeobacter morelensis MG652769 TaxID=2781736 RepID=A0ABY3PLU9_9CYAN|nr:hypothetical protein [Gloeobacter morelensis]UFP94655.1 hypothetical protein ISF26_23500 [Gloeobacter morelensis MG652769]
MAILIANLGVSDLSVKVGECFLPVDVRDEPNVSENLQEWNERSKLVKDFLRQEIQLQLTNQKEYFRPLTNCLAEAYMKDPQRWQQLIRISRVDGLLAKAELFQELKIDKVYLFVTDQATELRPDYHHNDTVYLFEVSKRWFEHKYPSLSFEKRPLKDIDPRKLDALFDYYRAQFEQLPDNEVILVSIKGGTPQMQTALRIQALASGIRKLLFFEPEFSAEKVMAGLPSVCEVTSYWRFVRNQKHQAITQLLSRWDFDGAAEIWKQWNNDLDWASRYTSGVPQQEVSTIATALECAQNLLKLDAEAALVAIQGQPALEACIGFDRTSIDKHDTLQNLYAQCKIKLELQEIPDLLWRMSTFCELLLKKLALEWSQKLFGQTVIVQNEGWYCLKINRLPDDFITVFENNLNEKDNNKNPKREKVRDGYRLRYTHTLIRYVDSLFQFDEKHEKIVINDLAAWNKIKIDLKYLLDDWIEKRALLSPWCMLYSTIHSANEYRTDATARATQRLCRTAVHR